MEGKYFLKIHNSQGYTIAAICDEEILGKVFREKGVILDVSPHFYGGEKVDMDRVLEAIRNADIVVITGRRIVEKLAELGVVHREFALEVENQLHIQIVREVYSSWEEDFV